MLVSPSKPAPSAVTSLATIQSKFLAQFRRACQNVLGLGGEPNQDLTWPLCRAQLGQNVVRLAVNDQQWSRSALLNLLLRRFRRAVIGDGGGGNDDVGLRGAGSAASRISAAGFDAHEFHAAGQAAPSGR